MATSSIFQESAAFLGTQPRVSTICVDLDGTLIRTDLLGESLMAALRANPAVLFLIPLWLLQGRSVLKAKLAHYLALKAETLPYNRQVVEFLQEQKRSGTTLHLATAAYHSLANAVAQHLNLFDRVLASDEHTNNKGGVKLRNIQEMLDGEGFFYAGDSKDDLAIWRMSRGAILVGVSSSVERALHKQSVPIIKTFEKPKSGFRTWVKELRLYQWSKNVIVFTPMLLSHHIGLPRMVMSLIAFAAFSLCASTFYVLNDLLDIEADRNHPRKCKRPFAAGDLSIQQGILAFFLGILAVVGLALALPGPARTLLALYAIVNFAYSAYLKRTLFLDVIVLASLYTLRLLLGGAAEHVSLSIWTLAFSMFLFLGLALIKRFAELFALTSQGTGILSRRAYTTADVSSIRSFATSALYMSVLVLALYLNSPDVVALYRHPQFLWFVCLLLVYWVSRVALIANRGQMSDDPVIFALKDRPSLIVAVLVLSCVLLAL